MRQTLQQRAWLQWALWMAICVVLGHLSLSWHSRFDATHDQRFSRATATLDAVRHLDRPLHLDVWFTEDLGAPYQHHLQALRDLIADLQTVAGDTLEVRYLDPTGDPQAIARARIAGMRPITYARQSVGQSEARQVWMGVGLTYGDRAAAVDALPSLETLEGELTRAILSVRRDRDSVRTVGWLQGHGEPSLSSFVDGHPLANLGRSLQGRANLVEVHADQLPDHLDALLIVGPQQAVPEAHRYALDQFVMGGGATGWFVATWQPDFGTGRTRRVDHNLSEMLASWGISPADRIVLDRSRNERMSLPINGQWLQVNTPIAPLSRAWDPTYRPVRDLEQASLPFTTALNLRPLPSVDHQVWLRSEATSVLISGPLSLDPRALNASLPSEQRGSWPLVAAVQGSVPSFLAHAAPPGAEPLTRSRPMRMVVAGSADLVANRPDLLRNTVDWLLEDQALLGIRARSHTLPMLTPPPAKVAWAMRLAIPGFGLWMLAMVTLLVRRFSP